MNRIVKPQRSSAGRYCVPFRHGIKDKMTLAGDSTLPTLPRGFMDEGYEQLPGYRLHVLPLVMQYMTGVSTHH